MIRARDPDGRTSVDDSLPSVDPFTGFVLGTAVGDALGLPREGLSGRRAARMFGTGPLKHGLVLGRGLVSDDTEHMRITALALLAESRDAERFGRVLAWNLRWWLAGLPAGIGMATAKGIIRLWLGWSPECSGVASAGNGAAMRAGILGLCLHREGDPLAEFVRSSTRITHIDPIAETGAMLMALATREAIRANGEAVTSAAILEVFRGFTDDVRWLEPLHEVEQSLAKGESAAEFALRLGLHRGVSGYMVHTVVMVLFCWLRWPGEFRTPMEEIIRLGGDTDTTAALLGGLLGASHGTAAIPPEWIAGLIEWPYSTEWMSRRLGPQLRRRFWEGHARSHVQWESARFQPLPAGIGWLAILVRNLVFLVIVLAHGFRRLLPPY